MRIDNDALESLLREVRTALPIQVQLAAIQAQVQRARFNAYVKEGFTEAQAIELCKVPQSTS